MNNIKKISIVLIMIILFVYMFMNKSYAVLNCNVSLSTPKDKVTYKEQFSVYVTISNLQTTKGIIAIGAVLSYDTNSLNLVDIEGENKWSDPFYSSSNGKITSFKNKLSTSNENVFKITFRVNEKGKTKNSAWIKIDDFEISDGDEEKKCGSASINVNIEEQDIGNSGDNNQGDNNQGGNNQGGSNQGGSNQGGSNQGGSNQGGSNQGGNNQGGSNQGGNNQGGSNQGGNKPNTVNPPISESTNNINNADTNNIKNVVEENSINDKNVINNVKNDIENTIKTEENSESSEGLIYTISTITVIVVIGILFLAIRYWKAKENK